MRRTIPIGGTGAHWRDAACLPRHRCVGRRRAVPQARPGELGRGCGRRAVHGVARGLALLQRVGGRGARPTVLPVPPAHAGPVRGGRPVRGHGHRPLPGKPAGTHRGHERRESGGAWCSSPFQLHSLAFFPLAFAVLVLSKAASIAKSSLVPWLVADDARLVAENARLSRAVALVGGFAGAIGALLVEPHVDRDGAHRCGGRAPRSDAARAAHSQGARHRPQPHRRRCRVARQRGHLRGERERARCAPESASWRSSSCSTSK